MTAEQGFRLHPLAAQDITEIWEYIAEDNPLAARSVREDILGSIRAVVPFPNKGPSRPDLAGRPLRFIVAREYLIAYAPEEKAPLGCRRDTWTAQPARDGRNSQRRGITLCSIMGSF